MRRTKQTHNKFVFTTINMNLENVIDPLDAPIEYWDGYKVVLAKTFTVQTQIYGFEVEYRLQSDISPVLAKLANDGKLTVYVGYPWDLNSAKVLNFRKSVKASCAHDVLCDMINLGLLPGYVQPLADKLYYDIAIAKGMWEWLVRLRLIAVTWYMAGKGAKRFERKIHIA